MADVWFGRGFLMPELHQPCLQETLDRFLRRTQFLWKTIAFRLRVPLPVPRSVHGDGDLEKNEIRVNERIAKH